MSQQEVIDWFLVRDNRWAYPSEIEIDIPNAKTCVSRMGDLIERRFIPLDRNGGRYKYVQYRIRPDDLRKIREMRRNGK